MKYTDYKQAINVSKSLCTTIAMEECAELIQAISKAKRGKIDKDNLSEEIADVLICLDWICEIYNIKNEDVGHWFNLKKERIVKRLNEDNFK